MKSFVINLPTDTRRLLSFRERFKSFKGDITRVNGIYGESVPDHRIDPRCRNGCTNGMKGCALAHMSLWGEIVKNNIPIALIFEDDAKPLNPDYQNIITKIINESPPDFDIINLHHTGDVPTWMIPVLKLLNMYNPNGNINVNSYIKIPLYTYGLSSYIISNKGAKNCLKALPLIKGHIDVNIFKMYKTLNIYESKIPLFTQEYFSSNNSENTFENGTSNLLKHALYTDIFKIGNINVSLLKFILFLIIIMLVGWFSLPSSYRLMLPIMILILIVAFIYKIKVYI
jgi:GR25 family glycosyltransferase involved in LPS biosynthesis